MCRVMHFDTSSCVYGDFKILFYRGNEERIGVVACVKPIWGMRLSAPAVVARKTALREVDIEPYITARMAYVACVHLLFTHSRVEVGGRDIECAHIQWLHTGHHDARTRLVGKGSPSVHRCDCLSLAGICTGRTYR